MLASLLLYAGGVGVVWAQDDYRALICTYDWDCTRALRVAECESSMNPLAEAAGNRGLFQISTIHRAMVGGDVDRLFDPETNVAVAYALYSAQGWSPWAFCGRR